MLRALWYMLLLGCLAALTKWLADEPGSLTLEWHGRLIETSAAMLVVAVGFVAVAAAVLYRVWRFIVKAPDGIKRYREDGRRRRGYLALTRGMVAVAAGDAAEASRHVERADGLLSDPPLTLLLSAQAAQLEGDEKAAEKHFSDMLERPETEFLGIRGLLSQAAKRGDSKEALKWARRAYRIKPKSEWVGGMLFDLLVRTSQWREADEVISLALRNKIVFPAEARRRKAILSHLLSLEAEATGDRGSAVKLAKAAHGEISDFAPAAAHYASLLIKQNKRRKGAQAIENVWSRKPHPDLAQVYWQASMAKDELQKVKAAEKLAKFKPNDADSLMLLAQASLDAGLWGEARSSLDKIQKTENQFSAGYCRAMARLEELENEDMLAAREWLLKAVNATPDPEWVCSHCGNAAPAWTPLCGKCGDFDTFAWGSPLRIPGTVLPHTGDEEVGLLGDGSTEVIDATGVEKVDGEGVGH